ncbi:Hpt domain-containing protein [Kordiimonas sp.]|uniref:Hpt domain-containing protein n=1 Tax=Kordiimonas sp. TaxID=1970157 RepID=UPI003A9014C1
MSLLDKKVLDKLTNDVGEESVEFLVGSLKQEIERTGLAISEHLSKGEIEQVEIQAHALKSAARSFGAMPLGDICQAIEEAARASRTSEIAGLMKRFRFVSAETIAAFG